MALFFTLLLGLSAAILGKILYDFAGGEIGENHARVQKLGVLIMALMSVVVFVSFLISSFVVNRINRIAATAREIMDTGDLSRRISVDSDWDDLSNLAQVLNDFLVRVESLMDGIREVSNNIAHDLRTPLTHLRNKIEELKNSEVNAQDLDVLLAESDQILAIFQALLRISNIEKSKRQQWFEEVDVALVLKDVIELYEPLAEEKNIRLNFSFSENQKTKGDKNLLFQLFANILENAIKFSPENSEISLQIFADKNGLNIAIADQGVGINAAERELVFRRFYRSDASRRTEGNGLGLSLAKAIIDLHQGDISLADNGPGLLVVIRLGSVVWN